MEPVSRIVDRYLRHPVHVAQLDDAIAEVNSSERGDVSKVGAIDVFIDPGRANGPGGFLDLGNEGGAR